MDVPELEGCLSGWRDEWEWMGALETMGASSIDYKEEYLREEVAFISLTFFHNVDYDNNDVNIGIMVNLSEPDQVRMKVDIHYDCKKKELKYEPIYILQGKSGNADKYTDEKSVDEYLSRYGLTRKDVQEYQEYAVYDIVVKTWAKAHHEFYWLERWKLKQCKVIDHTFQFEDE
ncbi:MAG: TipC family immunity protein [Lachnospiraceae bacterium]|nr:TipC family immunity protein [Lachnospiraceae bacterium]